MNKKERPAASLLAFMADLHHEIRSPVNTILNMTELAYKEEVPSSVKHYFRTIEKNANSLLTLLDDIIELSQDDIESAGVEQVFGMTDLLEDLKEAIDGPRKAKKTHMTISFVSELPEWFSGPRGRIRQILTQICNYCMRQLASKDIHILIDVDGDGESSQLCFLVRAKNCQTENCEPKDVMRNPRILICHRLVTEMDNELVVRGKNDAIEFSFSMKAKPLDMPWGEPIYPRPHSCIVSKDAFSSSLISRRLWGCGFNVERAATISEAKTLLTKEVSQSQKAITLVDWDTVPDESDPFKTILSSTNSYPTLFFDIPAIKMMHLSAKMPEDYSEDQIGFVMAPSKGRQVVAEVARLLKIDTNQLSCSHIKGEDMQEQQMDISPEDLAGMKVLVVEDDRINQRIVVELLKKFGIKPVVASTGKAASKAVRKRRFDAIFMDINLPDTDGYKLTEEIRTLDGYTHVPIIALTASTKNRRMCMEAGMDYFLSKPYSESKLLKSLIATRSQGQ